MLLICRLAALLRSRQPCFLSQFLLKKGRLSQIWNGTSLFSSKMKQAPENKLFLTCRSESTHRDRIAFFSIIAVAQRIWPGWLVQHTGKQTGLEKTCQILLVQTCRMISKHKDMYSMWYLSYTKTDLYGIGLVDPSINQSLWLWLQGGHLLQNTDTWKREVIRGQDEIIKRWGQETNRGYEVWTV